MTFFSTIFTYVLFVLSFGFGLYNMNFIAFLGKGVPLENQCLFQDSATHFATLIINVHHIIWFFAVCIAIFVSWVLFVTVYDAAMSNDFILSVKKGTSAKVNDKIYFYIDEQNEKRPIVYNVIEWFKNFGKNSSQPILVWIYEYCRHFMKKTPAFSKKYAYNKFNVTGSFKFNHDDVIEFLWLITPCAILILIGIPSFSILQALKAEYDPVDYIKIIGNQWYWTYEITDFCMCNNNALFNNSFFSFELKNNDIFNSFFVNTFVNDIITVDVAGFDQLFCDIIDSNVYLNKLFFYREQYLFDSYMLPESDLNVGDYRLLDVDYPLDIYANRMYQCVVTSNDVLHSWAVPSFGVKMDAIPGRLNQFYLYVFQSGLYYGQCSELCGVNHGFMPIVVRVNDISI